MVKIVVISASTRADSQSLKVSKYLAARIEKLGQESSVLDLHKHVLPIFGQQKEGDKNIAELSQILSGADGYVFVSPEWHGSMSAGLVNMLVYVGEEMAHKPVMLVGVSGSNGGTYPLSQMRQLSPKNTHYVISPENLIVRDVKNVMYDTEIDESAPDHRVKSRAEYSLKVLLEYSKALQSVRASDTIDMSLFPNGV